MLLNISLFSLDSDDNNSCLSRSSVPCTSSSASAFQSCQKDNDADDVDVFEDCLFFDNSDDDISHPSYSSPPPIASSCESAFQSCQNDNDDDIDVFEECLTFEEDDEDPGQDAQQLSHIANNMPRYSASFDSVSDNESCAAYSISFSSTCSSLEYSSDEDSILFGEKFIDCRKFDCSSSTCFFSDDDTDDDTDDDVDDDINDDIDDVDDDIDVIDDDKEHDGGDELKILNAATSRKKSMILYPMVVVIIQHPAATTTPVHQRRSTRIKREPVRFAQEYEKYYTTRKNKKQ